MPVAMKPRRVPMRQPPKSSKSELQEGLILPLLETSVPEMAKQEFQHTDAAPEELPAAVSAESTSVPLCPGTEVGSVSSSNSSVCSFPANLAEDFAKDTPGSRRMRNVVATLNNYASEEWNVLTSEAFFNKHCTYLIIAKEIAPTTRTPHLQMYFEFKNAKRFSTLKELIPRAYFASRRGTALQASDYCKKTASGDNLVERGELTQQGKRNDWAETIEDLKHGESILSVLDERPHHLPCINALKTYQRETLGVPMDRPAMRYIWIYGKSQVGKSALVRGMFGKLDTYAKPSGRWFDGYTKQKIIWLEDFVGDTHEQTPTLERDMMLKLCDPYQLSLPIKGGYVPCAAKLVVITSNYHPSEVFKHDQENAFEKRFIGNDYGLCINLQTRAQQFVVKIQIDSFIRKPARNFDSLKILEVADF